MKQYAQSSKFGRVSYTVQTTEFFQAGTALRNIEDAWHPDGTPMSVEEEFELEDELKARGVL